MDTDVDNGCSKPIYVAGRFPACLKLAIFGSATKSTGEGDVTSR